MNYDDILKMIDKKIGQRPRKFNWWDKLTWYKQDKPGWDWGNDEIRKSVENWENVFKNGRLTWGYIVQVNTLMFEKSDDNCPGDVLIWLDDVAHFNVDSFELVAEKLFEIKGYSAYLDKTDEKEFAARLEDEMVRAYGIKIPRSIANHLNVCVSTVFFQRRHIPGGIITDSLFPVLHLETPPMAAVMVPSVFWPKELLEVWR